MIIIDKITKENFDKIYNKYPPSNWIKFAFKYFSSETENKNLKPKKFIIIILLFLFFVGYFFTIFNLPKIYIKIITITYSLLLSIFVLYLFSAVFLNKYRLNKIRKKLGITKEEFNELIKKYYS